MAVERHAVKLRAGHTAVAIFKQEADVVLALRALHAAGYPPHQISLLSRDARAAEETAMREGAAGSRTENIDTLASEARVQGAEEFAGMAIGGTVGFVVGLTAIAIPGFGPFLLAAGPLAIVFNALTASFAGLGLGALWGAIFDERVTEAHRDRYQQKLAEGAWLVIVHGEADAVAQAGQLLEARAAESVECF